MPLLLLVSSFSLKVNERDVFAVDVCVIKMCSNYSEIQYIHEPRFLSND